MTWTQVLATSGYASTGNLLNEIIPQMKRTRATLRTMKRLLRAKSTIERIITGPPCSQIQARWRRVADPARYLTQFPAYCLEAFHRLRLPSGGIFYHWSGRRPSRGRVDGGSLSPELTRAFDFGGHGT